MRDNPAFAGDIREPSLVEAVRQACASAARDAYEDAGLSGLCAEGRWEAALDAVMTVDLSRFEPRRESSPEPP